MTEKSLEKHKLPVAEAEQLLELLTLELEIDEKGTRRYYNRDGYLHRDNGPAVIWADGTCAWFQNGLRHCANGPAVEWTDGTKWWYLQGVRYAEPTYYTALTALGIQNDH